MADSCNWSSWATAIDWGICTGANRARLEAFVGPALATAERLAAALHRGADLDLLAALSSDLEVLGLATGADVEAAQAIQDWAWTRGADLTQVCGWWRLTQELLETVPVEIQFVAVAVLTERIGRALLAAHPDLDPAGLLAAVADLLQCSTCTVLLDVVGQRIQANVYRTM